MPALALPDVTKPFQLCVDEKEGVARGELMQEALGPCRRQIAYLLGGQKLDPVATRRHPCQLIIVTALLKTQTN